MNTREMGLPYTDAKRPHRSIEDFRGDFEQLATFMQSSWRENKSQPLLYTPDTLASYFSCPGATFQLAPTMYENSRIVAFIAGFPRTVRYRGKTLRAIIVSLLTVASGYKKSGYGLVLWNEIVKRARAAGFVATLNFCVEGDSMNGMMLGTYQYLRVPAAEVFSIRYLVRLIVAKHVTQEEPSHDCDLVESFLDVASAVADRTPLCRIWSRTEAEWQCLRRPNSIVVSHCSGARCGFLTGYVMPIADRVGTRCALIEDVLWGELTHDDRRVLVQKFVNRAAFEGARMVVVPIQGYADPEPFLKSHFLRSQRILRAYMGLWDAALQPEPVSSFYTDVF